MNILHIARVDRNKSNGVSQVVPKYLEYQTQYANVALLNCEVSDYENNTTLSYKTFNRLKYNNGDITKLDKPFDKPDLVVFHEIYMPYFAKVCKYLIKNNIKYIIVPHGGFTKHAQYKKRIKKIIANKTIFKKYLDNVNAIQYLSKNEKESSIININKTNYISGNGMEVNEIYKSLLVNKDEFRISYIGRIDIFHKGLDLLIEACKLIKGEMKNKKIRVYIYGPEKNGSKKDIQNLIDKYELNDLVSINNAIYNEEKERVLAGTDVVILSSRFEGQPLAAIEAISKGIPIIATEGTNITDEIREYNCGWACKTDARDISRAILDSYDSKDIMQIYSKNCIHCANDKFDWNEISKNVVKKYKKILQI